MVTMFIGSETSKLLAGFTNPQVDAVNYVVLQRSRAVFAMCVMTLRAGMCTESTG